MPFEFIFTKNNFKVENCDSYVFLNAILDEGNNEKTRKLILADTIKTYENLNKLTECKEEKVIRHFIIELFVNHQHRRNLLKEVVQRKRLLKNLLETSAQEIRQEILEYHQCNVANFLNIVNFLSLLQSNVKNELEELMGKIFIESFYNVLKQFLNLLCQQSKLNAADDQRLNQLTNNILKHLLPISKNKHLDKIINDSLVEQFIILSFEILKVNVTFDIRAKVALFLVYLLQNSKFIQSINSSDDPITLNILIFFYKDCAPIKIGSFELDFRLLLVENINNRIAILSAIFNASPLEILCENELPGQGNALYFIYSELISSAQKVSGNSASQIIEISRTLWHLTKHFQSTNFQLSKELNESIFFNGLEFIWSHCDHFIDSVRSSTKQFFTELINYARKKENSDLSKFLWQIVNNSSESHTARFQALENVGLIFGCDYLLRIYKNLPENLLKQIIKDEEGGVGDLATKTYTNLMKSSLKSNESENVWINCLIDRLANLNSNGIYILLAAIEIDSNILHVITANCEPTQNINYYKVLLNGLKIARRKIDFKNTTNIDDNLYCELILKSDLIAFQTFQNDEIRLAALTAIVDVRKSTALYNQWELNYLLSFIKFNSTSQHANIRKQIITAYKHALDRLLAGLKVLQRNQSDNEQLIDQYMQFLNDLARILIGNLSRDAMYPRRVLSLELLIKMKDITQEYRSQWIACWKNEDIRNCLHLLNDSYEGNKEMAVLILVALPLSHLIESDQFFNRSIAWSKDIRPSKTLTAAYMLKLLIQHCDFHHGDALTYFQSLVLELEQQNMISNINNVNEIKTSHYGIILSLRHVLNFITIKNDEKSNNICKINSLFKQLLNNLFAIKDDVLPLLCSPSPEGYLPSVDIEEIDESATAQTILVYAWRTIKEMTLLLADIVKKSVDCFENTKQYLLLDEGELIKIADLFLYIFIASKHRGVFEQAFVGFSEICLCFWQSSCTKLNKLPKKWLKETLQLVKGDSECDKLCATRRSAGLPFLLLSILTTEPSMTKTSLHEAMDDLLSFAENSPDNEYKLHSMNVLRAIFRHSKLGESIAGYIGRAVIIALKTFRSCNWTIRNSGTLLFSSLMVRMFGVQRTNDTELNICMKNRLSVRVFILRYEDLFKFLLEVLKSDCGLNDSLILHPILLILARLYPSCIEEYNSEILQHLQYINICLQNSIYRTRDLAAKASVSLIPPENVFEYISLNFQQVLRDNLTENNRHGLLLQLLYLIKTCKRDNPEKESRLLNSIQINFNCMKSALNASLYMEIFNNLIKKFNYELNYNFPKQSSTEILEWKFNYYRNEFIFKTNLLLQKSNYEQIKIEILKYLCGYNTFSIYFLIYLNNNSCNNNFSTIHPLIDLNDEYKFPNELFQLRITSEQAKELLKILHTPVRLTLINFLKNFQSYQYEEQVIRFLLLSCYKCVEIDKIKLLDFISDKNNNSELICTILTIISMNLKKDSNFINNNNTFLKLLINQAMPFAENYCRLSVARLIVQNSDLLLSIKADYEIDRKLLILNAICVLLEDDDEVLQNSISHLQLPQKSILISDNIITGLAKIPEKIKEEVLNYVFENFESSVAIAFIFSWMCRYIDHSGLDDSNKVSLIFEEAESNIYAENNTVRNFGGYYICLLLKGKKFKEITETLLEALENSCKFKSMEIVLSANTRQSLINALTPLLSMDQIDFKSFQKNTLNYLKINLSENQFCIIQQILLNIYKLNE